MIHTQKAVVAHLRRWVSENLRRHDSPGRLLYHEIFSRRLDEKRFEQEEEHDNKGLFGMSSAAGCMRANAAKRAGIPSEPVDADTLSTWEIGHLLECKALAILEASGFTLGSAQVECHLPPAHLSYADGVLTAGPVDLPYPVVLSVKTSSFKMSGKQRGGGFKRYGFCALPLDGIYRGQPSWYVQAQLEMAALGIDNALVLVIAKDMVKAMQDDPIMQESGSLTWYAELVRSDRPSKLLSLGTAFDFREAYERLLDADPVSVPPVLYRSGQAPPDKRWIRLPAPGDVESGWGGENQQATGDYNPCFSCQFASWCREVSRAV